MNLPIRNSQPALKKSTICPFLGLADDAQTALAFPSDWNCCHHCKPLHSVKLEHQRKYCLKPNHKKCAVYLQPPDQAMPRELRNRSPSRALLNNRFWKIIIALGLLALVTGLGWVFNDQIGSFIKTNILDPYVQLPSYSTAVSADVPPTPVLIPSITPDAAAITETSTPLPAFISDAPILATTVAAQVTPTITRLPQEMGNLIGINYLFKIHRVKRGENLDLLAYANGTTAAAIIAVNYHLTTPLWPQQIIIIPVNQTDVSDLPPFEPYRVSEDTSTQKLAEQLDVDAQSLQYYNGLGSSDQLVADEWIVVPREE